MDGAVIRRAARVFNERLTLPLLHSPFGRLLRGSLTTVQYVGRRSGRQFTLPVGYRRRGEVLLIAVVAPEAKRWWRNFLGAGAPLRIELDGGWRDAHAVALRRDSGRVWVRAVLR